jgi:hypothetical protein
MRHEQLAQLEARGLTTFEIDLSTFGNGEINDSFARQLLEGAPRSWLLTDGVRAAVMGQGRKIALVFLVLRRVRVMAVDVAVAYAAVPPMRHDFDLNSRIASALQGLALTPESPKEYSVGAPGRATIPPRAAYHSQPEPPSGDS